MIFICKVTNGQERIVSIMLSKFVKKEDSNISAIAFFPDLKGYIFVETQDENTLRFLAQKIKNIKRVLPKKVTIQEIEKLIEKTESKKLNLEIGDVVEMISGPFKGEKAKVIRVDPDKDEAVVELLEVAVPIPVTTKLESLKISKKANEKD